MFEHVLAVSCPKCLAVSGNCCDRAGYHKERVNSSAEFWADREPSRLLWQVTVTYDETGKSPSRRLRHSWGLLPLIDALQIVDDLRPLVMMRNPRFFIKSEVFA